MGTISNYNKDIKKVANQKIITIHKEPTDRQNPYFILNLEAFYGAIRDLQSEKGIKLYLYLAKNQNEYKTALSSSDFCEWANCGRTAYNTAVAELIEKGYLINKSGTETIYTFFDKAREKQNIEEPKTIEENREELSNYRKPEQPDKKGFVF